MGERLTLCVCVCVCVHTHACVVKTPSNKGLGSFLRVFR